LKNFIKSYEFDLSS